MDKNMYSRLVTLYHSSDVVESVRSYSGRGMYGRECVAVTVDSMSSALWYLGAEFGDELDPPSYDNMGRGYVLYWPRWEWSEEYNEVNRVTGYDGED